LPESEKRPDAGTFRRKKLSTLPQDRVSAGGAGLHQHLQRMNCAQ
jgi:hypothetical protein